MEEARRSLGKGGFGFSPHHLSFLYSLHSVCILFKNIYVLLHKSELDSIYNFIRVCFLVEVAEMFNIEMLVDVEWI